MAEMTTVLKNVTQRRTSSKSNVNCCVYGCNSVNKRNYELNFHIFPPVDQKVTVTNAFGVRTQVDRRKLWETTLKMGKPVSKSMRVCSKHFKDEDYITPNEACFARRVLKKTSIPSENLPKSSIIIEKQQKQINEERLQRLMKRRQVQEIPESILDNRCDKTNSFTSTDDVEVAECLLLMTNGIEERVNSPKNDKIQFISVGTQTEQESCYCMKSTTTRDVETQVCTEWFSISQYINTDKALDILTGITSLAVLSVLIDLYVLVIKDVRSYKLSVRDRILLMFLKLKLDLTYSALSVFFDISIPTCKKIFVDTIEVLSTVMGQFIYLPPKENIMVNMPSCFKNFQSVRIVLDCTEIRTQIPTKLCCKLKLYSHYKKAATVKFMTAVTPAGLICYVSPAYGGRASDKSIFEQSKLIEKLDPYIDHIMVDKGFLIDQLCADYGIKLVRPPFLRKKRQFNKSEALYNKNVASARVHIERVNARIKIFRIFKNAFPQHLLPIVDEIFTVVCGAVNLSSPIFRDELFLD